MTIKPIGNRIYLGMENVQKIGDLDVSSKQTIREIADVISVGPDVKSVKIGDKIMVKAWGCDTITYDKQDYFFVSENSDSICAIIQE